MKFDSLVDDSEIKPTGGAPRFDELVDDEETYGSLGQQAITGLEGAASAATFGLSTGLETKLGVDPADIRARREANPGVHMAGQVAGLVGTALIPGLGEANAAKVMSGAGKLAAKSVGLGAAEKTAAKLAQGAVTAAAENAMFQAGDEVSKMFSKDPEQRLGTALANVGLSGLVGGGFGMVPPLWKATAGTKVTQALNGLKNKAGGVEGSLSNPVKESIDVLGVSLPAEIKAGLSDDPVIQNAFKTLQQSDTTKSGMALQQSFQKSRNELADSMVQSLGKDPTSLSALKEVSDYKAGVSIADTLAKEVSDVVDPIVGRLEKLKTDFADTDLVPDSFLEETRTVVDPQDLTGTPKVVMEQVPVPGTTSTLADKIGKMAMEQGWMAADEGADRALVNMTLRNLPRQKTLRDLSKLISSVGKRGDELSSPMNFGPSRTASMINGVLREGEADIIISKLGVKNPTLADEFRSARSAYRDASLLREELQSKIGVKSSTPRFSEAIKEYASTDAEKLLARLTRENNADLLRLLEEKFPATATAVKQYQLDSIVGEAVKKAKPGEVINPKVLIKGIENLSPEMKAFVVPEGAVNRIRAVSTLLEQFEKSPHNFSNTARTVDKLFEYVPAAGVGMVTMMSGWNPAIAAAAGFLTKYLAKDAPDAIRLSMLKFLGSANAVDSAAFKAMTDMADAVAKGERAVSKATRAVLKPASNPGYKEVSDSDRKKLDKQLLALQDDPSPLLNVGGDVGYYLPEDATAMAETAVRAVNYLNSLRPSQEKMAPLDPELPVDPTKKAEFERALEIAENPLIVLENVKNGTVLPQDLMTLQNVAPGLYSRMREKLTEEIIQRGAQEEPIPYKTRLGLAMFFGQPLDSTMTPESIMAAQPKPPMPQQPPVKPTATGMQKLSKIGPSNATRTQSREMDRAKRLS